LGQPQQNLNRLDKLFNMPTYNPEVFELQDLETAKSIILTDEAQVSTEQRWQTETPYLLTQLQQWCEVVGSAQVLDFGCGIGRMSKALIENTSAHVWGVDASQAMRQHAMSHVASPRFAALGPHMLDAATQAGQRLDLALSVWVLQHCPDLNAEINRLYAALKPGGLLFVVDMQHRAIPTLADGWVDDGLRVEPALNERFNCLCRTPFAAPHAPNNLLQSAWIALFQKSSTETNV
jgi:2-polyprenyl-3-methyl-5-hydroxy-6-metoxy-1,4-benzoquinol methylase